MENTFRTVPARKIRESDTLFKYDVDWQNNACLNISRDNWVFYAQGFKKAGDVLVNHAKSHRGHLDTLIYPIVFNYRQYIELCLKMIIAEGSRLLEKEIKIPTIHKTSTIWNTSRKIIETIFYNEDISEIKLFQKLIDEFSRIDDSSTAFRYPVDTRNNPSLPGIKYINIRNLQEVIEGIETFLEGVLAGIFEYLDQKREFEAIY